MLKKLGSLIVMIFLFIATLAVPALGEDGKSLQESLDGIVGYYADNRTSLDSWEEVVGLSRAGLDLAAESWQLPDWRLDSLDASSYPADYARTILGMLAAGQDPRDAEGRDIVADLASLQDANGNFGARLNDTIWSMVALDTAGASYNTSGAAAYLLAKQLGDGGFALSGYVADADMTGFALIALAPHADVDGVGTAINLGKECLKDLQLDSGGFSSGIENTESTASVIRGLVACGEDITGDEWIKNGSTMIDALFAFQLADYSFAHIAGGSSNSMATRQALIAVADMVNAGISYTISGGSEEAKVRVRVEGATSELLDKEVTLSVTALEALKAAAGAENVTAPDGLISEILGESAQTGVTLGTDTGWFYYVIRNKAIEPGAFNEGPGSYQLQDGDELIFYLGAYDNSTGAAKTYLPVITVSPAAPAAGGSLTISLSAQKYDLISGLQDLTAEEAAAIGSYTVSAAEKEYPSADGQVTIPNLTEGTLEFQVSNASGNGYPDVVNYKSSLKIVPGTPLVNIISVQIAIVGETGKLLYGPDTVDITPDAPFGYTAMSALDATGLSWSFSDTWDGLVVEIEGEENEGMNGWMYSLNGHNPSDVPMNIKISDGDRIVFWYSSDPMEKGPTWSEIIKLANNVILFPAAVEEAREIFAKYDHYLDGAGAICQILHADDRMTTQDTAKRQEMLDANQVDLTAEADEKEAIIVDSEMAEVSILVPEDALDESLSLTVEELSAGEPGMQQYGVRIGSSVYDFGPSGTEFRSPITVCIKIAPNEAMNNENLTLAGYDKASRRWAAIPAIIDLKAGLVIFRIDHFSCYALINLPTRVTFTDVGDNIAWAKEAIEILAGQGVARGTEKGLYEPDRSISRAEFVQLITKARQWGSQDDLNTTFSDVKSTDWFAAAVTAAYQNKVVTGFQDGTFRPNNIISRNEVAMIFSNMGQATDISDQAELPYADLQAIPAWASNAVKYTYQHGLMSGYEDKTFGGDNPLTRGEAAVILFNYLNKSQAT